MNSFYTFIYFLQNLVPEVTLTTRQSQPTVPAAVARGVNHLLTNQSAYQNGVGTASRPLQQPSLYWTQQQRSGYNTHGVYPANQYLHQHTTIPRERWSTGENQVPSSSQILNSQSAQRQCISPPPGFGSTYNQNVHNLRHPQLHATQMHPTAIQTASQYNRGPDTQLYPLNILGTLAASSRYIHTQVNQAAAQQPHFFLNTRQQMYPTQIGQLQPQAMNYRANWAAYNTNNNLSYNNSNSNPEGDSDGDAHEKPEVRLTTCSIESIESDHNRESSSKEKAKCKPRPLRSNLIRIVPNDECE